MNKNEITALLAELHNVSGFRISLHGIDFEEIAAYPDSPLPFCKCVHQMPGEFSKCMKSDAEACKKVRGGETALIYKCRYGLTEVICPLYSLGSPTGYLMMGQAIDEEVDRALLKNVLLELGVSADTQALSEEVPRITAEKTTSFAKIMTVCAEYMTLINALPGNKASTAELTRLYVYENYRKKIAIKDISQALGRTKSAICPAFKEKYGITVMDYLTDLRVEEAKKMLLQTDLGIGEIAGEVGFTDTSYFSKVFYKKIGVTPSQYRRDN